MIDLKETGQTFNPNAPFRKDPFNMAGARLRNAQKTPDSITSSTFPTTEKQGDKVAHLTFDSKNKSFVPMPADAKIDPTKPHMLRSDGARIQFDDEDQLLDAVYTLIDRNGNDESIFPDGISHIVDAIYAKKYAAAGTTTEEARASVEQDEKKPKRDIKARILDFSSRLVKRSPKIVKEVATVAATLGALSGGAKIAETHAQTPPPASQGINEPTSGETSETTYNKTVTNQEFNSRQQERPEALNPAETALYNLTHLEDGSEITLEYLAQHPQDIRDVKTIKDLEGNAQSQFVLIKKDNGAYVYETHLDSTSGKFTDFKTLGPKIPIKNPNAVAVSPDKQTVFVGGAEDIGGAPEKLFVSYDGGKKYSEILWTYPSSGGITHLQSVAPNVFFGNAGQYEDTGIGPFFTLYNPATSATEIKAASVTTVNAANVQSGGIINFNPDSVSISQVSKNMEFYSAGSAKLQTGINHYKINYETFQGTVENIKTVKIEEQDINLGSIFGLTFYTDANGAKHALAANGDRKTIYDIDLAAKTATQTYYGRFLDGKNIPDLSTYGALTIAKLHAIKDAQGKAHVWFAGGYATATSPYYNKAVIGHYILGDNPATNPDSLTEYSNQLRTIQGDSFIYEKGTEWDKYNGQTGFRFMLYNQIGEAFLPVNSDGSPVTNAKIIFPDDGIGSAYTEPTPTPTATPVASATPDQKTPTPTPDTSKTPVPATATPRPATATPTPITTTIEYKVFIPIVSKNYTGGW